MLNTGARVQEIFDVRPSDVQLVTPAHVRLFGKGEKNGCAPCGHRRPSSSAPTSASVA